MRVAVSIVSHAQGALVEPLLGDLAACRGTPIDVVLTLNVPESLPFDPETAGVPIEIVRNAAPKGFGANHNAAFARTRTELFCVLNPDIRLQGDPFPPLIECLGRAEIGVVAPLVRSPQGSIEDSARRFPTPGTILAKLLRGGLPPDYSVDQPVLYPDWVAGMFMVFRRESFAAVQGFDERYFLYYEDVDLCARLRLAGLEVAQVTTASVTHAAQRRSRANLRHARWHVASMFRFFAMARRSGLRRARRAAA